MPHRCCVPKCRGNYDASGPKVAVFSFPQDPELRKQWLCGIQRKDFVPTKASKVCELHFQSNFIEKKTTFKNETTGEILEASLKIPRLVRGAVPTKMPGCPSYMSKDDIPTRISPESKRQQMEFRDVEKAIAESIETATSYNDSINFSNLAEAFDKLTELDSGWVKGKGKQNMCFFFIDESHDNLGPKLSVFLSEDLNVKVFFANTEVKKILCSDKSVIKFPLKVTDINTLKKVLSESKVSLLDDLQKNSSDTQKQKFQFILELLQSMSEEFPEEKKLILKFIQEQLNLLTVTSDNCLRYSCELSLFACLLYTISPHAYKFLRSANRLILPSPRTLKTICASFNTDPRLEQTDEHFLKYASNKFKLLENSDKTIVLMMDEIHLRANVDYKGGNIVGGAYNRAAERATSAHTFMISSLLSPYKDVVHVLPVSKMCGEELHKIVKKVIIGLEKIGFEVIAVITDNNALNRKAMSFFMEEPQVSDTYPHPCDPSRPLFFIIDPVHIIKNIRNNWINQKPEQEFNFPDFEIDGCMRIASFNALKELHIKEKGQLLKYGYTLSLKALYPSSMERQSVPLTLQVFNHNTVAALKELGPKICLTSYEDTAIFLQIICMWWDIMNVKTPLKGQRLRNKFQEPVTKGSAHIIEFLTFFLEWLQKWKLSKSGKLTKETHEALHQSTSGLLKLSQYCLNVKNFRYVLLGKLQTDKLEERFGKYRYEAGAQYHVYIRQIFETESKLRINSVIPLIIKSKKFGNISISKEDISDFVNDKVEINKNLESYEIPVIFKNCGIVNDDDISAIAENEWPPLVYVAGYSAYSVMKKINCEYCKTFLTAAGEQYSDVDYSLISATSRGGLCYPSEIVVRVASFAYIIVQKVIIKEEDFLRQKNQHALLRSLIYNCINEADVFFFGHNDICHNEDYLIKLLLNPMVNILIKNYVKKRNDTVTKKTMPDLKRLKKY